MEMALMDALLLALCWLLYFLFHSFTASLWLKQRLADYLPWLMPAYRLLFNLLALLLLLPSLALMYSLKGEPLWQWTGYGAWLANGLALLALLGFAWSLRYYDGMEFFGLRQWKADARTVEDQEAFHLSPLHRFVRHPWYALALVLIWTRDMDPAFLLTAVMASLYFIIGSRLEEQKLIVYHGEAYRRYRTRVPGFIPRPWRHLRKKEAAELELQARRTGTKASAG
jgi:protein-S-isoprenylcysteine O-methyltransferase Ste14